MLDLHRTERSVLGSRQPVIISAGSDTGHFVLTYIFIQSAGHQPTRSGQLIREILSKLFIRKNSDDTAEDLADDGDNG
jgi:hypothetical protein